MRRNPAFVLPALFALLLCGARAAVAQVTGAPVFLPAEIQRIQSLGPWPPAARVDPGNRVSGRSRAIQLGRLLFADPRMSPVGYIACVTCHQPDRSFTDQKSRAHGLADLPRNTPSLMNVGGQRWFGWGGSSDSLWMASIQPMLDAREFDSNPAIVSRLFRRDPELADCYRKAFGVSPLRNPERTVVNVGKALAAFQETLVTERTAFDDFRDALMASDTTRMATYPAAARRGLKLFVGAGQCVACHAGPAFTDGEFHPGPASRNASTGGAPDAGRLDSAHKLRASHLNLLGRYNDDASRVNARATQALSPHAGMRGQYRTPGLRNVALTGPYLHDGRLDYLRDAVQHPWLAPAGATAAPPLTAPQVDDLVALLVTLTDRHGPRRPFNSLDVDAAACR